MVWDGSVVVPSHFAKIAKKIKERIKDGKNKKPIRKDVCNSVDDRKKHPGPSSLG
jgi:hypothetical protein